MSRQASTISSWREFCDWELSEGAGWLQVLKSFPLPLARMTIILTTTGSGGGLHPGRQERSAQKVDRYPGTAGKPQLIDRHSRHWSEPAPRWMIPMLPTVTTCGFNIKGVKIVSSTSVTIQI
jgi:hypothetical protein